MAGWFSAEPLWVDLRWARKENLSIRHSRFRQEIAALAAPIHSVGPDTLENEDLRQRTLATGSVEPTVRLWDVADPARPRPLGDPLEGHTDSVRSVVFSPDGKTLATASHDGTVRLWDVADPARPRPLGDPLTGHPDAVTAVVFSPDGLTLATASHDGTVRLWDASGLSELRRDIVRIACLTAESSSRTATLSSGPTGDRGGGYAAVGPGGRRRRAAGRRGGRPAGLRPGRG
jgi:WD40 repeat protein